MLPHAVIITTLEARGASQELELINVVERARVLQFMVSIN